MKQAALAKRPIEDLDKKTARLVPLALRAKKRAYAPYSKYPVGCILVDSKGKLHSGCNVENACYPAGLCAERTAIVKMISRKGRGIKTIIVAASSDEPVFPCGMCLQVIQEFGKGARIVALSDSATLFSEAKLEDLFPFAFSPDKLEK